MGAGLMNALAKINACGKAMVDQENRAGGSQDRSNPVRFFRFEMGDIGHNALEPDG